jgi:chloramphenicol-sensitive protein RarD
MDPQRKGIWLGVAAYVVWGVTPLFWNLVDAPALEVLAHRILWACPIVLVVLAVRRRLAGVRVVYAAALTRLLAALAGVLVAINWGVYIWAVTNDHIVEASLGYFINPLVSVALGVIVLKEHLRPAQRLAVIVATVGVAM